MATCVQHLKLLILFDQRIQCLGSYPEEIIRNMNNNKTTKMSTTLFIIENLEVT